MKFSTYRPVKIVMLGAGGTGGYAAPEIYRILKVLSRTRNVRFILIDGDIVEATNLDRQNFFESDLGENKAKVLAESYSAAFGIECEYIPRYIESDTELEKLLTPTEYQVLTEEAWWPSLYWELVILIGCVDNNKSRQMCDRVFRTISPLVYIDAGNGTHTGQVVCGIHTGKRIMFPPVGSVHPDILADTEDKFPSELSCEEAAISAPQSMVANMTAANLITNFVYNIVFKGELEVWQTHFSTDKISVRADYRTPKRKKKTAAPNIQAA